MRLLIYALFIIQLATTNAQTLLDQPVTVSLQQVPVQQALLRISDHTGIRFSYNPASLPDKNITASYDRVALKHVLYDFFGETYEYKERGSYVILRIQQASLEQKSIHIKGEFIDAETGQKIPNITIYEIDRLDAALSGNDGSYELEITNANPETILAISGANYRDTLITVTSEDSRFMRLILSPVQKVGESLNMDTLAIRKFLVNQKMRWHDRNVKFTEGRFFQASVLPGLGTNGKLASKVKNNLSLNLIGGFSGGVKGLELGGIFNITNGAVEGLQMGAVLNTSKEVEGAQLAGVFNYGEGKLHGSQLAGVFNVMDSVQGVQGAGAFNVSRHLDGLQMAGIFSHAYRYAHGWQLAGVYNYTKNMTGVQAAGLYNHVSDTAKGLQMAGLMNRAGRLEGVQVGVINQVDTVDKGLMIGLINIAKDEVLAVDVERTDVSLFQLSFKSGVKVFYTIFSSGVNLKADLWSFGAGLGSEAHFSVFYLAFELTAHGLLPLDQKPDVPAINPRLGLSLGVKLSRRISVHGGPVINYLYYDGGDRFNVENRVADKSFYRNKGTNVQKWWVGYSLGMRF